MRSFRSAIDLDALQLHPKDLKVLAAPQPEITTTNEHCGPTSALSDASDDSTSSSSSGTDAVAEVGPADEYFLQGEKVHIKFGEDVDTRCVPYCRRKSGKAFKTDPIMGPMLLASLDVARGMGDICLGCLKNLTDANQ